MTAEELEQVFARWWADSYGTLPGPHARMTHVGFAQWLLETYQEPEPAA